MFGVFDGMGRNCLEQHTYLYSHPHLWIGAYVDGFGGSDITSALADVTGDGCGVFLQVDGVSVVCFLSDHLPVCVFKAVPEGRDGSR